MKSPCEGAAQVGYTKDIRAIWRRGKDVVRKCNPPIPYKP